MRRVRSGAALLLLLLLLAGVPYTLATTIGSPAAGLTDLLAGDITDAVLVDLLAAVAWGGWAQFAVAAVVEGASAARRSPLPRALPCVLPSQQQLARTLISALFLLAPAGAAHPGNTGSWPIPAAQQVLAAAVGAPGNQPPATATIGTATTADALRPDGAGRQPEQAPATWTFTIPAGQTTTLWDLAQTHLGDGQRWREIWQLNEGRPQPHGATFTSPSRLRPGWSLQLPITATRTINQSSTSSGPSGPAPSAGTGPGAPESPSATAEVTVQRGDTLSELAAAHGQPDWRDAWHTNAGHPEPGGASFTDPDLIRPGWHLTLPIQAASSSPPPGETPRPPAPPPARTSAAPGQQMPPEPGPVERAATISAPPARSASGTVMPPAGHGPAVQEQGSRAQAGEIAAFLGGGAILAAGSLAALRGVRRQRLRERTLGRALAPTPAALVPIEKALHKHGPAGAPDAGWLDTALRSLSGPTPGSTRPPDLVAVRLSPDDLQLTLTTPHREPPSPWSADADGLHWTLCRNSPLDPIDDEWLSAPYPALVTIGTDEAGAHWLVDLERIGALALTGDSERCTDLARFLAAELAHNAWSDHAQVTLAGFGDELARLDPSRITYSTDPAITITTFRNKLGATANALHEADSDVLTGRTGTDTLGDGWPPQILLLAAGPTPAPGDARSAPAELASLLDDLRAQRGRAALAVVLIGAALEPAEVRWQFHVGADGRLAAPALELMLTAHRLPESEAENLAALLALAAAAPDITTPPARGDQPWDTHADALGAPRVALTEPRSHLRQTSTLDPVASSTTDSVLPLTTQTYLTHAATTADDVTALAPAVAARLRRRVEHDDPTLDADLAAWHRGDQDLPRLALLGPITLHAPGPPPSKRRGFCIEIATYLSARPLGVTAAQLAADFWPDESDEVRLVRRIRSAVSATRAWLGADPQTGRDHLPLANEGAATLGLYRVHGLLTDAELFRRLRLRGTSRGSEGIPDLESALNLVTGPPLEHGRPGGYLWLIDTPIDHEYTAMIIDVAHLVATHHLAEGHPADAARAAHTARLAGSQDDVALLDLVAAADAAGNQAEADHYIAAILANHSADVEEDLPPRTCAVLSQRRWLPGAGNKSSA